MKHSLYGISIIFFLLTAGCGKSHPVPDTAATKKTEKKKIIVPPQAQLLKQTRIVNLYFANPKNYGLSVERRKVFNIPDKPSMILQVLSSLEFGPRSRLAPTIPANLSVRNVFTDGKTIFIDLKREKNHARIGGIEGESLLIHSLVNTALAIYPEFKRVRFLVNGAETDSLLGHIDATQSFIYDRTIVIPK
ncbi:MAG: GerMN domain-containing protein [Acidobacteria bacterium]|nr:GerMN domain-containing protein [Acidobacteriota bacterium]